MSRSEFRKGGKTYRLWIRVDTDNKKGFPDEIVGQLSNLMRDPRWSGQVKLADKRRLVMTPPVFDHLQSELDLVPKSYASLYSQDEKTGKFVKSKALYRCEMFGDKVRYDALLRAIRF